MSVFLRRLGEDALAEPHESPFYFKPGPVTDEDLEKFAAVVCERAARRLAPGGSFTLERLPGRDAQGNLFYLTVKEPLP